MRGMRAATRRPSSKMESDMTPDERRREILAQPSVMKEVYGPEQDTVDGHVIGCRSRGFISKRQVHVNRGVPSARRPSR